MTPTELAAVIEDHRLWLAGKGGKRAILRYADLSGAILDGADLRGADLGGIRLGDAAHFRGAIISRAQATDLLKELGLRVL